MLATWPMVFAALGAGVVVGVVALGPPSEPRRENMDTRPVTAIPTRSAVPQAPVIEQAAREAAHAENASKASAAAAKQKAQPCERQEWPYRDAYCLDRTVTSPVAVQMVTVRPADPNVALNEKQDAQKQSTQNGQDSAAKAEAAPPAKPAQAATPAVPAAAPKVRRAEEAAPPQRRADQALRRQTRTWAEAQAREEPDPWGESEPRAFVQRDGRVIYVYPERRYIERRYLPPMQGRLPDGW